MMNELIEKVGGLGPAIVLISVCLNAVLSAVSVILDKIKDLTPSDADNKAAAIVKVLIENLQKVIDFFSANVKH